MAARIEPIQRLTRTRQARRILTVAIVASLLGALLGSPAALAQSTTITGDGVGPAMLGMTVAEMEQALGADYELVSADVVVDFDGYEVTRDGEIQFFAASQIGDDEITLLLFDRGPYATAAGIGAGSALAEAEAAYGTPTLAYNVESEGREFAQFDGDPSGRIAYRTGSFGSLAGVYDDPDAGFGETSEYVDGATIESIWVTCVIGLDCPVRTLPDTGPSDLTLQLLIVGLAAVGAGASVMAISNGWER